MSTSPTITTKQSGSVLNLNFFGLWTASDASAAEAACEAAILSANGAGHVVMDLKEIERLDTMGAWLVKRIQNTLKSEKRQVEITGARDEYNILLKGISGEPQAAPKADRGPPRAIDIVAEIGETVVSSGNDLVRGVAFLGDFVVSLGRALSNPRRFRLSALINQIEKMAFRGAPIIILISLLVGGIIAQQSLFQLATYGTSAFVADLLGILILRELAVLLTAIMMAGRSGSSITAELGSMKMREEIDALRTMGLDPVETLVIPRVLALVIAMPILTFISSMSALFGGGLVAQFYGGVSPEIFIARLQGAIGMNTFLVGMIKAPFMALVIGLIACVEGLAVKGSAESLGSQTTASVVKSIFMVIVVDGLLAMFFAAIRY